VVFISSKTNKVSDYTVADILGKGEKKGKVGIEVEVEGRGFNRSPKSPWVLHQDGSLRGEDNAEYVLDKPVEFDKVDESLDALWAMFKADGTRLDETNRTSIHVHLNVLPFYQNRLAALMSLWFMNEDILTHWCGESRVGNHYCLRAKDSPSVVHQLKKYVKSKGDNIPRENFHYAAFNANAIAKFGSVEIRTLRGVNDPNVIKTWVRILKKLYDASEKYTDPRFLIEEFSLRGAVPFFEQLFGDLSNEIVNTAKLTREQLQMMLYEGMRYAQEISYSRDWSDFKPKTVPRDPFGRKETEVFQRQEVEGPVDLAGLNWEEVAVRVEAQMAERPERFRVEPALFPPAQPLPRGGRDDGVRRRDGGVRRRAVGPLDPFVGGRNGW
jgi:hypothetical protein